MPHEAKATFEIREELLLVGLSGSLGGPECAPILEQLAERLSAAPGNAVVDFTDVSYVGSFVIGKLLRMGQTCRERGCRMALASANGKVLRVLKLVGLSAKLDHYGTVQEARSALGRWSGQGGRA